MRIMIYMKDGTTRSDAMIESIKEFINEDDDSYYTKDAWGDIKKYNKEDVALITVRK